MQRQEFLSTLEENTGLRVWLKKYKDTNRRLYADLKKVKDSLPGGPKIRVTEFGYEQRIFSILTNQTPVGENRSLVDSSLLNSEMDEVYPSYYPLS